MAKERSDSGFAQKGEQTPGASAESDLLWQAEMERSSIAGVLSLLDLNQYELEKVLDEIPLPIFTIDTAHTVINWNKACEQITGISSSEILGTKDAWRGFYPDKRPVLADLILERSPEERIASLYGSQYTRSKIFPDMFMAEDFFPGLGENGVWLFFSASPLRDDEENIIGAIEILTDITQCKEAEEAFRKNEMKYRHLFEQSAVGIMLNDSEYTIRDVNSMALEILGYTREEMIGMDAADLVHPDDLRQRSMAENMRKMAAGEVFQVECRYRKKDGEYIPVEVSFRRLVDGSEPADHLVMFHDIVQRKEAEERIYQLAYSDELTGLPNRWFFHERLKQAMDHHDPSRLKAAVLLVDINRLRPVNDALGQQAGDELVREVANRLLQSVEEGDTVARMAGDEFMILAHGIESAEKAHELGKQILNRINKPLDMYGSLIYPNASIGFTLVQDTSLSPDTLIKQADIAMSGAKKRADKIQGFMEHDDSVSREFYMEHDLKRALKNKEFLVFYQPQIDFQTGRILGVEALLRWNHPERGLVYPGEFIPVLERTGMIAASDQWVLRRVCEQLKTWQEEGLFLKASVNLSAKGLNNERVLHVITEALEKTGLDASYLEVELTETEIMGNVQLASEILRTLSGWGIRVALDDFGKGYSCLSYLQKLDISVIKIDKEFVDGLPENRDSVALVQAMIVMAHNLGKKALAEGVESEDQVRILRDMGCDYGQGFLWGRPQPHEYLALKGHL